MRQQPWEVAGRTAELALRTTRARRASGGSPDERGSPPPPIPEEEGEGEEDRHSSDGDHQPQTVTPSPAKSTPLMDGYELQVRDSCACKQADADFGVVLVVSFVNVFVCAYVFSPCRVA